MISAKEIVNRLLENEDNYQYDEVVNLASMADTDLPDDLDPSNPEHAGNVYPAFVSLYALSQKYGGPEEGGWYYYNHELVNSIPVSSFEEAQAAAHRLYDTNVGLVDMDGKPLIRMEKVKGSMQRKTTPHYE
jgi:hypothetical protein